MRFIDMFFFFLKRSKWGCVFIIKCPRWWRLPKLLVRYDRRTSSNSWFPKLRCFWSFLWCNSASLPPSRKPSLCSHCCSPSKCHCSSRHDVTSTFPRSKPSGAAQTKEIVVLTRELTHMPQSHFRSVDEQSTISSLDGGCGGKAFCCVEKSFIYIGRVKTECASAPHSHFVKAVQAPPSIVAHWISSQSHCDQRRQSSIVNIDWTGFFLMFFQEILSLPLYLWGYKFKKSFFSFSFVVFQTAVLGALTTEENNDSCCRCSIYH